MLIFHGEDTPMADDHIYFYDYLFLSPSARVPRCVVNNICQCQQMSQNYFINCVINDEGIAMMINGDISYWSVGLCDILRNFRQQ